jgi:hypothetical protein
MDVPTAMIAAAAIPEVAQQLDPEQIAQNLDTTLDIAEQVASDAQSFANWVIHSAGLTEREEYAGWLPIIQLSYVYWKLHVQPAYKFFKAFSIQAMQTLAAIQQWAGYAKHITDTVGGFEGELAKDAQNFYNWLTSL